MSRQTAVRTMCCGVIALGAYAAPSAATAQQDSEFVVCWAVGECPSNKPSQVCAAIHGGRTWIGTCVVSGPKTAPCTEPMPERLRCVPDFVL